MTIPIRPIDLLTAKAVNQKVLKDEFMDLGIESWKDNHEEPFYLRRADYHYRRYMKGSAKTLHQVNWSIRMLEPEHLNEVIPLLESTAQIARDHEFYELLTRHESAIGRITKLINRLTLQNARTD